MGSETGEKMSPPPFSLRRRVQLCLVMMALESFISFEELFMLAVLQRVSVPTALLSLPGTVSSFIGIFLIPLLGWASDRFTCSTCWGQKRPYALFTLAVSIAGASILLAVNLTSLYGNPEDADHYADNSSTKDGSLTTPAAVARFSINPSLPKLGGGVDDRARYANPPATVPKMLTGGKESLSSATDSFAQQPPAIETRRSNVLVSRPTVAASSTLTGFSTRSPMSTTDSVGSTFIPLLGLLGIAGFTILDHGYDSSMFTFKTYMTAVTPPSQHDDILVMSTLVGAVGGCLTSLLGFVDLASLFRQGQGGALLDKGVAQCLVQTAVLLASLFLFGTCSLLTGSEAGLASSFSKVAPASPDSPTQESSLRESDKGLHQEKASCSYGSLGNRPRGSATTPTDNNGYDETSHLRPSSTATRNPSAWKRAKKRVFLCLLAFLGLCSNYAYFVYVSNYVAEVIYEGDPHGQAGTEEYANYVKGEHTASLGMLTFYCLFVLFNLLHNKILNKIGSRVEYVSASTVCCALMLTLVLTDNIIVFFLNAVSMAVFRSAVYTVPFMLSNRYTQQEKESVEEGENRPNPQTGVAMSSISAMIPASYFLVSLVMGPLMDITGYPGTPILFAFASCALGIVSTCFVSFQ